jgi:phosphatidylglycerophosphatase A
VHPPRGPESRIDPLESSDRSKNGVETGTSDSSEAAGKIASIRPSSEVTAARGSGTGRSVDGVRNPEVPHPGPALWVATAGGVGFGPWAPGTWGALVAVIGFVALFHRFGLPLYTLLVLAVTGIGVWASNAVEAYLGRPDDGRIVIDEVAGQLIAFAPIVALHGLPLGSIRVPGLDSLPGGGIDVWWALVVTAFVAFRWFDIRKPGMVKWAEERFEGGVGVMADDLVAGVLAAVVVTLPAYVVVVARLHALVLDGAAAG